MYNYWRREYGGKDEGIQGSGGKTWRTEVKA
jgi:hypothetical protein